MPKSILITIAALAGLAVVFMSLWKFGERETVTALKNEIIPEEVLSHETIELGGAKIAVEIRDTSALRLQGLSDRPGLKSQEGMLFVFDKADYHGFWMKNMRFPIDIIWFDENRRAVEIVSSAPPEGDRPKKIYTPREKALYALEINAGFAKEKRIILGDAFLFANQTENTEEAKSLPQSLLHTALSTASQRLSRLGSKERLTPMANCDILSP